MSHAPLRDPAPGQARTLDAVAAILARAQRILFVTGAGISVDSGLPTYRGIGGLYHDRLTDDGLSIEEALSASPHTSEATANTHRHSTSMRRRPKRSANVPAAISTLVQARV